MTNEKEEHSWGGKVSSKTVALAPLTSMPQSGPSKEPVVMGPLWACRLWPSGKDMLFWTKRKETSSQSALIQPCLPLSPDGAVQAVKVVRNDSLILIF